MANGTNVSLNYAGLLNADNASIGGPALGGDAVTSGNGGTASMNVAGNIFKPLGGFLTVNAASTGGNGAGASGNGGNATSTASGNIVNASLAMPITFNATALAGQKSGTGKNGSATASLSGNIVNANNNGGSDVSLNATAAIRGTTNFLNNAIDGTNFNGTSSYGTKTATVSGNILNGYINNATIKADAYLSNATANITGNILNSKPGGTGTVLLEAEGQKINITGNILNLGQQELDLTLTELATTGTTFTAPVVAGNIFNGTNAATNNLVLAATFTGAPAPVLGNTAVVDLGAGTLLINGQSNIINKFSGVTLGNGFSGSITGSSGSNTLNGGAGNDYLSGLAGDDTLNGFGGNDILFGGLGNDTLDGGLGTDVAYFTGLETDYTSVSLTSVTGGTDGDDGLTGVERLKFLSPSHVMDVDNNGYGDLIFRDNVTVPGDMELHLLSLGDPTGTTTVLVPGLGTNTRVVGTGQFDPDVDRTADLLIQNTTNGDLSIITNLTGVPTLAPSPIVVGSVNWKAISTGDFNGDAASDILLQNQSNGTAEIITLNVNSTDPVGTVASTTTLTTPGANWKAIAVGDFNGDGKSDIVWQNSSTQQVETYLMNGTAISSSSAAMTGTGLTAVATGDFNNDGKSDILFKDGLGNAVIWFMNGNTVNGTQTISNPGGTYTLSGAEDVDGNGYSDIIWNDATPNTVEATLLGGPATANSTTVLAPAFGLSSPLVNPGNFSLVASTGGG